jgi:hypothetical protein
MEAVVADRPFVPPPEIDCPVCRSSATTATKHPTKKDTVILDCGTCGHTSVVALPSSSPTSA